MSTSHKSQRSQTTCELLYLFASWRLWASSSAECFSCKKHVAQTIWQHNEALTTTTSGLCCFSLLAVASTCSQWLQPGFGLLFRSLSSTWPDITGLLSHLCVVCTCLRELLVVSSFLQSLDVHICELEVVKFHVPLWHKPIICCSVTQELINTWGYYTDHRNL